MGVEWVGGEDEAWDDLTPAAVRPWSSKRGRKAKLTDYERSEVVRRRRAGEHTSDLAREFGVSPGSISYYLAVARSIEREQGF